jgi:cytosine/adenosine deaminase-related metal-dependent hydrolase
MTRETRAPSDESGRDVASAVLDAATAGGVRALGLPAGRIEVGRWGALVVIDLDHLSLAGGEVETLAEALVCGADNGVVLGTYVGGSYRSAASVERRA